MSRKLLFHTMCHLIFLWIYCLTLQGEVNAKDEKTHKKVALLFLTIDDLNHSQFWKNYLTPHLDKFNIYVHAKNQVSDPFFAAFSIPVKYETTWSNTIVAERGLIVEAFANADNYKFVLLSNSCVPLVDPEILYETLVKDDRSYFFWTVRGWWERNGSREVTELPEEHRTGNNMWFTLNRKHAELCVLDEHVVSIVSKHFVDNESYPSCLFSVHGCLNEVINFGYTFVDWSRPEGGGAHPHTFNKVNRFDYEMLTDAKSKGYLFARKFSPEYPEKFIKHLIHGKKLTKKKSDQDSAVKR